MQHSPKIRRLVSLLSRLPGVGEKTAQRYVLHLLTADPQVAKDLGGELTTLHEELRPCDRCGNIAEVPKGAVRLRRTSSSGNGSWSARRGRCGPWM